MNDEVLTTINYKNDFYKDNFKNTVTLLFILFGVLSGLTLLVVYLHLNKPKPVVFAADKEWRVLGDVPLNTPYLARAELLQWVSNAIQQVFSTDFVNFNSQQKKYASYFTDNGYTNFQTQIAAYESLNFLQENKFFVNATAAGTPIVEKQGLINNIYSWWIKFPIVLNYSGVKSNSTLTLTIRVLVTRISTLNNVNGVLIDNILVEAKPRGDQNRVNG